eukprot:31483-Pelagococcus_subviridis.AAC.15
MGSSGAGGAAAPKTADETFSTTLPMDAPAPASVEATVVWFGSEASAAAAVGGDASSAHATRRITDSSTPSARSSALAYAFALSRQLRSAAKRYAASSRRRSRSRVVPNDAAPVASFSFAAVSAAVFVTPPSPPSPPSITSMLVVSPRESFPNPLAPFLSAVAAGVLALSDPPPGTSTLAMRIFISGSYASFTMKYPHSAFPLTLSFAVHTASSARRASRRSAQG